MTEADIYERLTGIFRELLDDDTIVLGPDTTAADVPEWDSLAHVNIVVACEAAFGVSFRAAELEELHRVGDLVGLIERKRAAKA